MPGVAKSIVGESHKRGGLPLQDYSLYREDGDARILIVADGAGSAARAEEGSQLLTETLAQDLIESNGRAAFTNKERFRNSVLASIYGLRARIIERKHPLEDYHSTLTLALVYTDRTYWAHIGDGLITFFLQSRASPELCATVVSRPENGESSNETFFFTDQNLERHLRTGDVPQAILGCLLVSDGMEDFIFNPKEGVKERFCIPLIEELLSKKNDTQRDELISSVLTDKRTNAFTNDDKSLAIYINDEARAIQGIREQFYFASNGLPLAFEPEQDNVIADEQNQGEENLMKTLEETKRLRQDTQKILESWEQSEKGLNTLETSNQRTGKAWFPSSRFWLPVATIIVIGGSALYASYFYPKSIEGTQVENLKPRIAVPLDNGENADRLTTKVPEQSSGLPTSPIKETKPELSPHSVSNHPDSKLGK